MTLVSQNVFGFSSVSTFPVLSCHADSTGGLPIKPPAPAGRVINPPATVFRNEVIPTGTGRRSDVPANDVCQIFSAAAHSKIAIDAIFGGDLLGNV